MPVRPDGSLIPGSDDWSAAGWLGPDLDHPTGPVGEPYRHLLFCERLFEACRSWVVATTRGFHLCPFCPPDPGGGMPSAERHGRTARLGNGEIHATEPAGGRWAAPTLVYHYVTAHDYRPPDGFVDAVTAGSLQPPDRPPMGAIRLGDATLGSLAGLDPDLHATAVAELIAGGATRSRAERVEITVQEATRFEEPGVWRPVLAWHVAPPGRPGGHLVIFDGTGGWRPGLREQGGGSDA